MIYDYGDSMYMKLKFNLLSFGDCQEIVPIDATMVISEKHEYVVLFERPKSNVIK